MNRSIHVAADGLVYIGPSNKSGFCGTGAMFAGDSFLVSDFEDGLPVGQALRVSRGELLCEEYTDASRVLSIAIAHEMRSEYVVEFLDGGKKFDCVDILKTMLLNSVETTWKALVAEEYWVRGSLTVVNEDFGYLDGSLVFLKKLPQFPPSGKTQLGPGLYVGNCDLWYRRFLRLVNMTVADELMSSVIKPVGVYLLGDTYYVISTSPGVAHESDIVAPEWSEDSSFEYIYSMAKLINVVHSNGLTFLGSINPKLFVSTQAGRLLIDTGRLAAHISTNGVYGGFDDVRYLSASRIQQLPVFQLARKYLHMDDDLTPIGPIEDDCVSFGLLISNLCDTSCITQLSNSQYILLSTIQPSSPWLSVLCLGSVDFQTEPELCTIADLSPCIKLAYKLIERQLNIVQLMGAIEKYREWQDGSSVETEVKAVFSKVSSIFQSGQEILKQAVSKNEMW